MSHKRIVSDIVKELKTNVDPVYREGSGKFFKEKIHNLGVRTPIVRKIGNTYYQSIKHYTKKEIFELAEALLECRYDECATIAFAWIYKQRDAFSPGDFSFFKKIVETHVTSWARCDDFCTHTMGAFLTQYPEYVEKIKTWTRSRNRWKRRAAAVSFIYPARNKLYISDIFEIADALLRDEDDMVQKGYGWMLKDASLAEPAKVYNFVVKRKADMPRTALRYALERYPAEMRKEAMS